MLFNIGHQFLSASPIIKLESRNLNSIQAAAREKVQRLLRANNQSTESETTRQKMAGDNAGNPMEEIIKSGTMLIAEGAILPESLQVVSEPYAYGWRLVKNFDSQGFNKLISQAGWNFFYIAGAIEINTYGSDEKKTTRKAIKQVIARLKSKNFNCLEITLVTAKRSLGLPYVSVSAHSRHIQKSMLLLETEAVSD